MIRFSLDGTFQNVKQLTTKVLWIWRILRTLPCTLLFKIVTNRTTMRPMSFPNKTAIWNDSKMMGTHSVQHEQTARRFTAVIGMNSKRTIDSLVWAGQLICENKFHCFIDRQMSFSEWSSLLQKNKIKKPPWRKLRTTSWSAHKWQRRRILPNTNIVALDLQCT